VGFSGDSGCYAQLRVSSHLREHPSRRMVWAMCRVVRGVRVNGTGLKVEVQD
jgi:hypothetical protein